MHRADGRGIDRLDLDNPDFARQLDVLIAGRGGNPQNNGMKTSLEQLRAARSAASTASTTRRCSAPATA